MLPARSKRYVGHDGRIPREHTLSMLELFVGLVVLIVLLALMFPRDSLMQRIFVADVNDPLTIAYVANLSKLDPDNAQLKKLYLQQRLQSLPWQALREETRNMLVSGTREERHIAATLLLLKIAQTNEKSDEMLALARDLVKLGLEPGWASQELKPMIEQALALTETDVAHKMLVAWWQAEPESPWDWLDGLARRELGQGRYAQSALVSFLSRQFSTDRETQKRYFFQGMSTLIAGGLYQDVAEASEVYSGDLIQDEQVLRKLIQIAQSSGQLERANVYAKLLLEMK
jgi:hypothetical protein